MSKPFTPAVSAPVPACPQLSPTEQDRTGEDIECYEGALSYSLPSLPSTLRERRTANKTLDLWLEAMPADNAIARAVDRRRRNDRLIVEAIDG